MKHDPHLHQARARHRCVIFIHHRIHAERDDEDAIETFIVQNWDSRVWATARPNGIVPISCPEMMTEEAAIVYDIYTYVNEMIGQFSRDLHWWGVDSKEIFEKRKPWWFSCVGCQDLGRPCRWCEKYDKACRLAGKGYLLTNNKGSDTLLMVRF
jgi:hypothetical protein